MPAYGWGWPWAEASVSYWHISSWDYFSKQKPHRHHVPASSLALMSASAMLNLCLKVCFSNAKASRQMKLYAHICHDTPCHWPILTLTFYTHMAEQCLVVWLAPFLEHRQQLWHSHSANFLCCTLNLSIKATSLQQPLLYVPKCGCCRVDL